MHTHAFALANRVHRHLLAAILVFVLHGIEEGSTGILTRDPFFRRFGDRAVYVLAIEIVLIIGVLFFAARATFTSRTARILLNVSGVLMLVETQHLYGAVLARGYYPGLFSAIVIVALGLSYWRELIHRPK